LDRPLLNDADIYPTDKVLASVLGDCSEVYQAFTGALPEYKIELGWRYYNDGKAWLGKAVSNKKTVFWLSIWQGSFKVSFNFTEKNRKGIMDLPVADEIKTKMENGIVKGKLVSLVIDVSESAHLKDIYTLISYKQSCK
jgi:hypothetical protein